MNSILAKKDYLLLYILLGFIYLFGLGIPLMENDSAQHATMAMRMYLEKDFLNIYKGGADYLDKPHLHFWLAALSFKIFGVSQWAYRIPALLFTVLGAFSANKLAKHLYGNKVGHMASLIFLSAQAIILANHDVRTDAVLTGAVVFGVWQLALYADLGKLQHAILGAFGVGLAFSTKGQLGVFIPGACLLSYILYSKKWKAVFNWKVLAGIVTFVLTISPILYAYYIQYDLHPEKLIEGQNNISGVRFILWDQSFNRLTASGFEQNSPDYFFFFHTLLWAFLPWSVLVYTALFIRLKQFFKLKFKHQNGLEFLTVGGGILVMVIISFSKFKLPHYLNSLLPIFSVLVAGFLGYLFEQRKERFAKVLLIIQYASLGLGSVFIIYISFFAFGFPPIWLVIALFVFLVILIYFIRLKKERVAKIVIVSVAFMTFINLCLNTHFYPNLLKYQAGNNMATMIEEKAIPLNDIFKIKGSHYSWSLDFYTKRETPRVPINEITNRLNNGQWLFAYQNELKALEQEGVSWSTSLEVNHFRITRLQGKFINPKTRDKLVQKAYLLQISK